MIGAIDEAKEKPKPGSRQNRQTPAKPEAKPSRSSPSQTCNRRSNMPPALMNLKVLLPFQVFAEKTGVSRIVAETREGSFGLLPHRLDCVAALAPGILTYETEADGEVLRGRG